MPDKGTMQDHIDDLMSVNKQLRAQRDHYRRALQFMAETIANCWSDETADNIVRDALEEVRYG